MDLVTPKQVSIFKNAKQKLPVGILFPPFLKYKDIYLAKYKYRWYKINFKNNYEIYLDKPYVLTSEKFEEKRNSELLIALRKFKNVIYLNKGGNRYVWRHKNWVIKIPLNQSGITDNFFEAEEYRLRNVNPALPKIPKARCKLAKLKGISVLVMEFIDQAQDLSVPNGITIKQLPNWVPTLDCWQVGYSRTGQLVAYDYAQHYEAA